MKEVHDIIRKHAALAEWDHSVLYFRFILDGRSPKTMTITPPAPGFMCTSIRVDQRPIQTWVDRWFGWFTPFAHWRVTRYIRRVRTLVLSIRTGDSSFLDAPAMALPSARSTEAQLYAPLWFQEPITCRLEWQGSLHAEITVFLDGMRRA